MATSNQYYNEDTNMNATEKVQDGTNEKISDMGVAATTSDDSNVSVNVYMSVTCSP